MSGDFDYPAIAADAAAVIADAGRNMTLRALDTVAPDPLKPWRGAVNPRLTPLATVTLKAVFVPLNSAGQLGLSRQTMDLIKTADELCLVGSTLDLAKYQELVDSSDGRTYKIMHMEVLAPGDLRLLTYLVLKQC